MEPTTIAIDLAKRVFQIHFVDTDGTIHSKALKRAQMLPFFANRPAARIVMEACGSAHHWARQLTRLGHEVRLIAAQFVRPFVKSNKNDAADAAERRHPPPACLPGHYVPRGRAARTATRA
jgi:transposase